MEKFKNKYRIQSHRMPQWDYSGDGIYFITFVTQHRECNLGKIINGEMFLSDWGNIVNDEWLKSFEIRNELFCDEYIIMPNHLHAIVVLDNLHDGRGHGQSQQSQSGFFRKPKSISSFIAGFKSAVNSKIDDYIDERYVVVEAHGRAPLRAFPKYNRNNHFFQPNYHDHIVRNEREYQRIKQYIINNPSEWDMDKINPDKGARPCAST